MGHERQPGYSQPGWIRCRLQQILFFICSLFFEDALLPRCHAASNASLSRLRHTSLWASFFFFWGPGLGRVGDRRTCSTCEPRCYHTNHSSPLPIPNLWRSVGWSYRASVPVISSPSTTIVAPVVVPSESGAIRSIATCLMVLAGRLLMTT